ncbi:MAG: GGDEF domain-containing protein [Thiomicrorhabdus sp.]|jgi:diguanylate cyclase|nr:GGDEF domain-containing protein [Thiomicrorhabdus sp.]
MFDTKDLPEKAKRIFDLLIEVFEEQNINPTPLNYFVWYQYYKGDNPKFRQEMDTILNDPFGYNDRVGKRLYDEYLTEDDKEDSDFDRAFRRLMDAMIKKMDFWSCKLSKHTKEIDDCTNKLSDPNINAEEVKKITNSILTSATSMKESSMALQEEMANSSETAYELRQQLVEARAEAMRDELTDVGNRKAFNNSIEELMFDAKDNPNSLYLVMADIDNFKEFNDTYGHLVGDSVLRYFASIMKKTKGDNETICRYGGEEFAILMAESTLEQAIERAEGIRKDIQAAHLKQRNSDKPLKTITSSFGIARFHGDKDDAKDFLERADNALYLAKKKGRNQVVDEDQLLAEQATDSKR